MNTYDTLADLYAAAAPSTDFLAVTLGRDAVADGLGGQWVWSAASGALDNTGTVVKPTAVSGAGRWLRQYTGVADVRWFGADSTGVAESTLAFYRAWYGTPVGCTILIPNGTYLLKPDAASNELQWAGRKWVGMRAHNTTAPILKANADGTWLVNPTSARLDMSGVEIDADNRVSYGLYLSGAHGSVLDDITARNATVAGFHLDNCALLGVRLYATHNAIGMRLRGCNGSLFLWPRCELNTSYGMVVQGVNSPDTSLSGNCQIVGGILETNCSGDTDLAELLLDGCEQVMVSGMYIEGYPDQAAVAVRAINSTHNCSLRDLRMLMNDGVNAIELLSARGCLVSGCGAPTGADTIYQETAFGGFGSYDNTIQSCRAISANVPRSFRLTFLDTATLATETLTQTANGELVESGSAPTAGRWRVGDRVGAYQCTVEGYPGTWAILDEEFAGPVNVQLLDFLKQLRSDDPNRIVTIEVLKGLLSSLEEATS